MPFPSLKMNVIARLEFELANYGVVVQQFSASWGPPTAPQKKKKKKKKKRENKNDWLIN